MSSSKGMMSQEQQNRLKNLNSRPFSVKSTSRPGTAQSQTEYQKENEYTLEDDVYEEISIPDVDLEERMKLL
jgi:sortase (surface protein transpeptidase)